MKAILDGRKTQTRRVVTNERVKAFAPGYADDRERVLGMCPYGRDGDRLWVRETWQTMNGLHDMDRGDVIFRADNPSGEFPTFTVEKWKSPLFLPRDLSRLTLEIKSIRVERLQEISEADAIAEGMQRSERTGLYPSPEGNCEFATWAFKYGWDPINGKRKGCTWADNPWVWAISFVKL